MQQCRKVLDTQIVLQFYLANTIYRFIHITIYGYQKVLHDHHDAIWMVFQRPAFFDDDVLQTKPHESELTGA